MTNLEAISIKLQEEKDKQLESILKISGSAAISKNEYNINVVNDNVASSLVFKELTKDKYDNEELVKAVDVSVIELKPNIPNINLDLVPRPVYNEKVLENEDLRKQVTLLTSTIETLNVQIVNLQSQVQTEVNNRLTIEQTNDLLVNQIETLNSTIDDFATQISTSLQKSIDESILRASLQSQNEGFKAQIEALIKQIDSLNSIVDGLQAQLGAVQNQSTIIESLKNSAIALGATLVNKVGLVSFNPKAEDGKPTIYWAASNRGVDWEFKYGQELSITNNDKDPISVELDVPIEMKSNHLYKFTISPAQTEKLKFVKGSVPMSKNAHSTSLTKPLIVKIIRNDGTSETKPFDMKVNIPHQDSYPSF